MTFPGENKYVTDYWLEYYGGRAGMCSICGNRGYIDSSGTTTPAGLSVGRVNFCICPNGQSIRYQETKHMPDERPGSSDWVNRLTEEHIQLSERIEKLARFQRSEIYHNMSPTDQNLLLDQLGVMQKYQQILISRIHRA